MSSPEQLAEADRRWREYRNAPKFRHIISELEGKLERESYVYSTPAGSVELWRAPSSGSYGGEHYGGVEVHSATQLYDFAPQASHSNCRHTPTGVCWHDGSSMAFDQFEHSFDAPEYIKSELADWHKEHIKPIAEGAE